MRRSALSRTALAVAIVAGVGMTGQVLAQATTGTIFGSAPTSGATVQVTGGAGFNRTVPVDSTGHYSVTVPIGSYTVNLLQNGAVVQSHSNVSPVAGGASEADFVQAGGPNAKSLSTVTVTANALPAIDVTSTTQNLTITAQQLKQLPLAHSATAIALLAPGTTTGAAMLGGDSLGHSVISFGGSTVVENAYYINGFNTSDPLSNTGGIDLPYGAIDQQQTLTSGYDAKYGRSTGGVISQVGKSGTNDWHFGGQVQWRPEFAQSTADNIYWNNPLSTRAGQQAGDLQTYQKPNGLWETIYDAYVGGPLIKDKLFFFVAAEADKTQGQTNHSVNAGDIHYFKQSQPKFYAKLDWNINDSNILSLTNIRNQNALQPDSVYAYNNTTHQVGAFESLTQRTKNAFDIWIGKYTSYITDNLTLNAMFGKMDSTYYQMQAPFPGYDPSVANILSSSLENPAYTPNGPVHTSNITTNVTSPEHKAEELNFRLDLDWKLGNHDLQFGIDNATTTDSNDGNIMTGPGYAWNYGQTASPTSPIPGGGGALGTPCNNGAAGCYVSKYVFANAATVKVAQRAQYVEDNWQITPNFLLNVGLRNDQFTNYNPNGVAYLRLTKPQWAPRIGFSWDVFGDSSLKVFGNAGRYYLAMPASVALREAGAPTYTQTYFTYTGITATGIPTGTVQVAPTTFVNGENGTSLDPKLIASQNIKAEYQDQYVLGMQQQFKMFDQSWVYGVTGTYNKLGRIIDDTYASLGCGNPANDVCPVNPLQENALAIVNAGKAQGVNVDPASLLGSVLINPGSTQILTVPTVGGGYGQVRMSPSDWGFPAVKRKYYSLELYLEHPFDGKWYGKIDYVFSRSYGNTEGPVQSNIGQGGSSQSATEQWDFSQIMSYSNGLLANDQKHQFRLYGSYQITPEWMVGATYVIGSGHPRSCLGFFGPNQTDPSTLGGAQGGYGSSYHWCNGQPTPGGTTGFTPWTHQLNLQVDYRPAFAQHKLDFSLQVHNVFNEQNALQYSATYNTGGGGINPGYLLPFSLEAPRYLMFGAAYDF
ncbi:TonB-dependent receptor plug domain-containing protein [Dyella agri]